MDQNTELPITSQKKPSPKFNGETELNLDIIWTKEDKEELKKHSVSLLHINCDKSMADSKNLPSNSYLIKYNFCDTIFYDIVQSNSKVKIFDAYYDKFGKDSILSISWTSGRVNPKFYGATKPDTDKKPRR